ncbi:MAG: Tol-Pal system beta propeller repeat protein TolB [Pseudomonadota bacterium]
MTDRRLTRRHALSLMGSAACAALIPLSQARAALEVPIDQSGPFQPMPIAIPDFLGDAQLGSQIRGVIANNLTRCGYFQILSPASYIEKFSSTETQPNFQSWRVINAQALVVGSVGQGGGGLTAQFRVWDIFAQKQVEGRQFTAPGGNWRRLAHILSDAIYEALIGEKGYFDSRLVFVDESGPKNKRVKRLAVMDQDGANVRALTGGGELVLTPRFSPNNREISFMQYATGGDPRVLQMNIETGGAAILGNFPGMTFSPRYSPDGRRLVMSLLNNDGNSNLSIMDVASKQISRVTNDAAIDTGGCFSPDGSRIVFESDRGGGQQLYVMSASGGGAQRISFGQGRYSTPVWSPKGDLIAFTKQAGGQFSIGVMTPEGQRERILTSSFHAEGPTWSPNGRVIMFFKDVGGGPKIYTIDVSGRFEQVLPTPGFASDPSWSGLLS